MMDLPSPLAVVAHDAGAANLIIAWLAAAPEGIGDILPVMSGPAAALWDARFPEGPHPVPLPEALADAAGLLSGTGWSSDLEHEARRLAAKRGIASTAVLDHWVNYRPRFERNGQVVFPDRVWVTDEYALREAALVIPEVRAELRSNLYLQAQVHAAGPLPANGDVLLILEPARSDWGQDRPGEFQTLDWFWRHRDQAAPRDVPIRLRPHPSDPAGKYDAWIAAHPGVFLDASADMAQALRPAGVVVGLQSAALVIALMAGRQAITALPPWAPPCPLPHQGLRRLAPR